jgi:hypothetical protein
MTVIDNRSLSGSNDDSSVGSRSRRSSNAGSAQGSIAGRGEEELLLDDEEEDALDRLYSHKKGGDEDVALVGSISHILRTLFRDLYVNPALPPGTKPPSRPVEIVNEESEEESAEEEEEEGHMAVESSGNNGEQDESKETKENNGVQEDNDDDEHDDVNGEARRKSISKKKSSHDVEEEKRPISPGSDNDEDEETAAAAGAQRPPSRGDNNNHNKSSVDMEVIHSGEDEEGAADGLKGKFENTMLGGTMMTMEADNKELSKNKEAGIKPVVAAGGGGEGEKLNANQLAAVEEMRKIDKKLAAQLAECTKTIQMLKEARLKAEIADKEEENELKGRGILVSAHIPIGPSHLSRTLKEAKEKMDMHEK